MTCCEIGTNLAINLAAGVIIFSVGFFWPKIPKSIRAYRLNRFFCPSVLSDRFAIVYGTLQDPVLVLMALEALFLNSKSSLETEK